MGYGPEDKNAVLELTYNYGLTEYDKGNGYRQVILFLLLKRILLFGNWAVINYIAPPYGVHTCYHIRRVIFILWQIALSTDNVYKSAEAIKLFGGKIILEPGPLPGINTKITACLDPDGWKLVKALILLAMIWSKFWLYTS